MFKWLKARRERNRQFLRELTERMEYANFSPNVTADDVLRIIRRDFPDVNTDEILALLNAYGAGEHHIEQHRVHAAILKLGNGDRNRVDHFARLAIQDFRDVLSPAEMPGFSELVPGLPAPELVKRSIADIKAITQTDRDQYMEWFNRANDR